jgi:hypothetical protein
MKKYFTAWVLLLAGYSAAYAARPYFQQEVNYQIRVQLDDVKHELQADETIEYTNNSSEALPYLYFHLWANAYKNNSTLLAKQLLENADLSGGDLGFHFAKEEDRGYIDQLDFRVNGETVKWEFAGDTIDICRIWLNKPLKAGEHITITTPFHVKIPLGKFSRMGHLGQQYQITQWYPKPAVYDRNGWNQIPFLNQGEFYSEYGTFDVQITLPRNYVIGATGDLVDGEEEKAFIQKKVEETETWVSEYKRSGKVSAEFPVSESKTKTLHFHQSRVHDFAWFCDKRYHILKGEVETPHEKRFVTTWLLFTDGEASRWIKGVPYIHDAVYFYSLWNGDYPYNQVTAVDGGLSAGAGMEYPNIAVIGSPRSDFMLETVIMHEVGHNWFYGILGSNERKNPWMDEGINSFNENRYIETKYPEAKLLGGFGNSPLAHRLDLDRYLHKHSYYLEYQHNAKKELDQPIQLPAGNYTSFNYGAIVYAKTAITFDYLMAYIGNATMDAAMQEYFETWKYKHPEPQDLRKILEKVSGKDLSWFFDDMIGTTKKLDYQIIRSAPSANGYHVVVRNTGQIKGPVSICGIKDNKLRGIVWYDGFWGTEVLSFPPVEGGLDCFMIDYNQDMPEINRKNNILRTQGLFKRIEPVKMQFLGSLDRPDRTQIFWTPIIGWNDYNHFMFGAAFYNTILPQKKLEYIFMPLYSAGSQSLAGYANIKYHIPMRNGPLQQITFGITGTRYAYSQTPLVLNYNRLVPELNFEIRKKNPRSHLKQNIRIRSVFIVGEVIGGENLQNPGTYTKSTDTTLIHNITYSLVNSRKLNPYSLVFDYQNGEKMQKLSLTAKYEITLENKKSITIRLFGGGFLSAYPNPLYAFRMSGEMGAQDYLYDRMYFGRSETNGILSQQFSETDGGFKTGPFLTNYGLGESTKWLTALNVKTPIPFLPRQLKFYADMGLFDATNGSLYYPSNSTTQFLYNAGMNLSLAKNIIEIYFPIIMSQDIQTYLYTTRKLTYLESIRFTVNLNLLNPFDFIRNFTN